MHQRQAREIEFPIPNVNAFGVNFVRLIIDKVLLFRNTKITRGIVRRWEEEGGGSFKIPSGLAVGNKIQ